MSDYPLAESGFRDGEHTRSISPGFGAVLVYVDATNKGDSLSLHELNQPDNEFFANVVEKKSKGESFYIAIFPKLTPGNYTVCYTKKGLSGVVFPEIKVKVSVFEGEVAEVDFRMDN